MAQESGMKVVDAARIMGKDPQFIRIGLQRGLLPFGWAIKISPRRWSYFISKQLFEQYVGATEAG